MSSVHVTILTSDKASLEKRLGESLAKMECQIEEIIGLEEVRERQTTARLKYEALATENDWPVSESTGDRWWKLTS